MTQSRDFGPLANELRAALDRYSRDELVDLLTHLLRIYVLDQTPVVAPELERPKLSDELLKFDFPQLLTHLQMNLDLPELERFRVGDHAKVFVTIGDAEFQLDGPTPVAAGSLPAPATEAAPAAVASAPAAPAASVVETPAPENAPRLGPKSLEAMRQSQKRGGGTEKSDRYRSIFGGGDEGDAAVPNIPMTDAAGNLLTAPPPPPPPIAEKAPGDVTPTATETKPEEAAAPKPAREAPPPPPEGAEKKIVPSNRFASLDFD